MSERRVTITFSVKEDILLSIKENKDEFIREILFISAVSFYRGRRLSLRKAAELAGCARLEFIEKLRRETDCAFDSIEEEFDEILMDFEFPPRANELPMPTEAP